MKQNEWHVRFTYFDVIYNQRRKESMVTTNISENRIQDYVEASGYDKVELVDYHVATDKEKGV